MQQDIRQLIALVVLWLGSVVVHAGIAWTDAVKQGSTIHFFYPSASLIQQFDLPSETVTSTISYSCSATAFAVAAEGYYIACWNQIYLLSFDGTSQSLFATTSQPVYQILVGQTHVYAIEYNEVWAIQKSTGSVQYKSFSYSMQKAAYSEINRKIYARNSGVSPADIVMVSLNADGSLGTQTDSPYHGAYPSAVSTWASPDESFVIDSSGTMYGPSLQWLGSIGVTIDRMAFTADNKILANAGSVINLYAPSTAMEKTHTLSKQPNSIFLHNDTLYAFTAGATDDPDLEKVALADFDNRPLAGLADPQNMNFVPDSIVTDNDGIIYLLHKASKNIFRWSIPEKKYLSSIPLFNEIPYGISYTSGSDFLYVLYANGEIQKINPDTLTQSFLYRLAAAPCGISATPLYVYACDYSGAWEAHYVISNNGTRLAYKDWNHPSKQYIWNPYNNRFYFFRDGTSPNDLMWEEVLPGGTIGAAGDSPYHGSTIIVQYPIRVSSNGSVVLLGSGQLFNATSLSLVYTLPEQISAAIWVNGGLWSAKKLALGIQVDQWSPLYSRIRTQNLYGNIIELINFNNNVVIISDRGGKPQFTVLTETTDIDADGQLDFTDTTPEGVDLDRDWVGDYRDNCAGTANADQLDTDNDLMGNACDMDDDGDGWSDTNEATCGTGSLDNASTPIDTDGDLACNVVDADDDNDGVADGSDIFPLDATESADTDSDGTGNNADTDDDSDGVADNSDAFPFDATESVDTDNDGTGNNADTDDDNDGVPDVSDDFPLDNTQVGDIDGDGVDGFVDNCLSVSNADQSDTDGDNIGDACELATSSPLKGARTGSALAFGDFDNDGFDDLFVGTPLFDTALLKDAGRIEIYSGITGSLLTVFNGTKAGQQFGSAIAVVPDQNSDGTPDMVIGEPLFDVVGATTLKDAGRVVLYSGADGVLLQVIASGAAKGDHFGAAVAIGNGDLIVGAPLADTGLVKDAGRVTVFDGLSNIVLYTRDGTQARQSFGSAVAFDDANGDILVGSPGFDAPLKLTDAGRVDIFDSADGVSAALFSMNGTVAGNRFGAAIASVSADIGGNTDIDWAVGSPGADLADPVTLKPRKDIGIVQVFSGFNATVQVQIDGEAAGDNFGAAISANGDINNDNTPDLAIGAPGYNAPGITLIKDAGTVEVFAGDGVY